jgi:4-amino-4-deoxy-L-arabinose transferase-like glycosyltransferase
MTRPDPAGWLAPAFAIVAAVTALRLVLLAFNRTDLFVDESQYWLWGQDFAFGYYSKPPLIAWVIGAVTTLAGSDAR